MHTKEEIQEALSVIIKRQRDKKGISQFDLAVGSDLHRTMIEFIERRKRMPTIHSFLKIADALELSPSILMKELENELEKK
ncbi:MAG: helix-turn-helix transcriptional regulator [Balneola sp.]|nr:helix-turn-helix transcriptional regulator [Balneola sp.]